MSSEVCPDADRTKTQTEVHKKSQVSQYRLRGDVRGCPRGSHSCWILPELALDTTKSRMTATER